MAHYDLLVIGSGPAGQKAAIQAAKAGKTVGIIERRKVAGGLCINIGTIPSKSLREAVMFLSGFRQRNLYGASYRVKKDITFEDLGATLRSRGQGRAGNYPKPAACETTSTFIVGTASILDSHRIAIDGGAESNEHTADYIVIAVGTEPARPPEIPFDGEAVIDSDELLSLKQLPKSLTIVGGGVIGCEYACILATLGIPVVLVERRPRLLEFVDSEMIESLQYQMRNIGVTLRLHEEVIGVAQGKRRLRRAATQERQADPLALLMYSAGRVGATKSLGLERIGIAPDERGRLKVNADFQTAVPHIYAVGDVVGFPALASTSMQQGRHAACHAFRLQCDTATHLLAVRHLHDSGDLHGRAQ